MHHWTNRQPAGTHRPGTYGQKSTKYSDTTIRPAQTNGAANIVRTETGNPARTGNKHSGSGNTTTDTQTDTDTTDHSVQQPPEQKSEPTENPATSENIPENQETENERPAPEPKELQDTKKSDGSDASEEFNESDETEETEETEETGDTTQNLIWLNSLFLTRFSYEMGRMQNLPDVPGIFLTKMQTIVKHPDFWTDLPNIVGNWVMEAYEKEMPDEQTALQFLQEKINAFIDNEGKQYLNQKEETPNEKETC